MWGSRFFGGCTRATLAITLPAWVSLAHGQPAKVPQTSLLTGYCVGCHSEKAKTAGVVLEGVNPDKPAEHAKVLENVLRKLRTGEMPPPGLPHPQPQVATSFAKSLETALDRAAATDPNPGRPAIHRLNRVEYNNAIRDLLAIDTKPGSSLPPAVAFGPQPGLRGRTGNLHVSCR